MGSRVEGLGFSVEGLGCRVEGFGCEHCNVQEFRKPHAMQSKLTDSQAPQAATSGVERPEFPRVPAKGRISLALLGFKGLGFGL